MATTALIAVLGSASGSVTTCWKDGITAPCGPGNDQCGPPQDPAGRPLFHIKDLTCDENDPNFPFYDEVHGMYHLMYQDHVCEAPGHGPDIGHVVSRDMIHWAHLPVSIWNDKPYDREAIFTGSATVVDGKPFIVYPGLCQKGGDFAGCTTGTNYAQAVPADASDPLYTNWTKDRAMPGMPAIDIAANPIVNGTSDDPSTAWRTAHGEWRLIGNAKAAGQVKDGVAPIFAAAEFTGEWKLVGDTPFPSGECPSFFPLPRLYPGTSVPAGDAIPTHVHKRGHGSPGCNGDCMTLGTWVDGVPGEVGNWSATPGVSFAEVLIDHGAYYASKDFFDAPNGRRINWGWATIPGGAQTMAREVTYHPLLKQLVHSPAPEYAQLHGAAPLATLGETGLRADAPLALDAAPAGAYNASDVTVTFERPKTGATLGVSVMEGALTVFIKYVPGADSLQVGIHDGPPNTTPPPPVGTTGNGTCGATSFGGDCNVDPTGAWNAAAENITTLAACVAKAKGCKMANFVSFSNVPGNADCSYYSSCDFGHLCEDCSKCGIGCPKYYPYESEVLHQAAAGGTTASTTTTTTTKLGADRNDQLALLPGDDTITLRVFTDRTVVEAYWQDGRVAMTSAVKTAMAKPGSPQVQVFSTADAQIASAEAWPMTSIWVSKEQVLATPRK
jgi:sucrose-6-phosphate hydrolase SacC (GH32 family)